MFSSYRTWGWLLPLLVLTGSSIHASDLVLDQSTELSEARPLDQVMIEGLNRFCLRELAASRQQRAAQWSREFSNPKDSAASIARRRERLQQLIGAVDSRSTVGPAALQRFELVTTLDKPSILAHAGEVTVHSVRWPVIDGVTAEGLLLVPATVRAGVVALPDADWTPEMFCGLSDGVPESVQFVRQLAAAGCLVAIPLLINRNDEFSGNAHVTYTNQPHREFIYRQAFEVGRHIIGYEVQKVLAAVDLIEQHAQRHTAGASTPFPIGVVGVGEGGLLALYSAALDPRIQCCWVSGYFQEREQLWAEPIYRNVWGLLTEFGDAELAGMIAPRRLVIEACVAVVVDGTPTAREGRRPSAAPGRIAAIPLPSVQTEFQRAAALYRQLGHESKLTLAVSGSDGQGPAGTTAALQTFAASLGVDAKLKAPPAPWRLTAEQTAAPDATRQALDARQKRQFDELQTHVQAVLRRSHQVRDAKWRPHPTSSDDWKQRRPALRDWVHDELIGRISSHRSAPNPKSRRVVETDDYVGYEVTLDVFDDVIAAGILLLPKDLRPGEKRPLVVCQHGLEGTPRDTFSHEPRDMRLYKSFSEELVKRGFLVYAPQNPYRGEDRFRVLQRMSNPLGRSLFSYIIAQHEQTLDWLATLPQVDPQRMAFYGLSYGGKTAVRAPPLIDKYCLSICSGDFTDWPRTIASNEERVSYLFTTEYETPEWNLAHVASYAELAMLMAPRPFMVEEGHRDGGQPTEWTSAEFGKVRRHYDQLQLSDRAVLEFFDGPHTIHGQASYRFLHRHLEWPERR